MLQLMHSLGIMHRQNAIRKRRRNLLIPNISILAGRGLRRFQSARGALAADDGVEVADDGEDDTARQHTDTDCEAPTVFWLVI